MRRTLALALLLWPAVALADAPKASIKGPARVAPESTIVLDARGSVADRPLKWKLDGPDVPFLTLDQDGRKGVVALVPSAPAGVYKFTLIAVGTPPEGEIDADAAILVVTVEGGPAPAPPTPPPNPTPTPTPDVTPTPAPVPSAQFRAVVVYETADPMTREQLNVIHSSALRAYLAGHCAPDEGGTPGYRFWDDDTPVTLESPTWQARWAEAKADPAPLPKVVIFGGPRPVSVPITTEAEALATLQRFGGN